MKRLILFLSMFTLLLSSCSLAVEDAGSPKGEDRLVGFLVSRESLDLFDVESYLEDNLNSLSGGEIVLDGDTAAYQDRLYAELREETVTDSLGNTYVRASYVFDLEDTFYAYNAVYPIVPDSQDYVQNPSSGEFCELNFVSTDTELEVTGTVAITAESENDLFYMNPIFQQADGRVYVIEGSACYVDMTMVGEQWTMTNTQNLTATENGDTESEYNAFVSFTLTVENAPESIVVREVAESGEAIGETVYAPGQLPEQLTLQADTEYLIVETHRTDPDGKEIVDRELIDRMTGSMETTYAAKNGVCYRQYTELSWK